MINYLLSQIQNLETQANNRIGKANDLNEKDRDLMNKRVTDLNIKYDNSVQSLQDVMIKLNNLRVNRRRGGGIGGATDVYNL